MKKVVKIVVAVLLGFIALNLVVFVSCRHGWRLFGFSKCESPQILHPQIVYVTDNDVRVIGSIGNSASAYVGNTYKIKDNVMYIGIKQNLLVGFYERIGDYDFTIEEDMSQIEKIYLTKGNSETDKCIWELEDDKKYMQRIKAVRLYRSIRDSASLDKIETASYEYADEDMLERMRNPELDTDMYITKGYYYGIAELENGEELVLRIDKHYDYYAIQGIRGNYNY